MNRRRYTAEAAFDQDDILRRSPRVFEHLYASQLRSASIH